MSLIIPANTLASGGFAVDNSCRFNRASNDYLIRTPTSGNYKTSTFSTWIKRSNISGVEEHLIGFYTSGTQQFNIKFKSDDTIRVTEYDSAYNIQLDTNRKFRDPSAWMHIVVALDTTQGTASNRAKLYINGVQETSFSTATYPSQNTDLKINGNTSSNFLGAYSNGGDHFSGYMAEVVWIDGSQLDPTSFGEFDEDSGIWKPIDVSGLTFGTNGFYLDFENSGSLGADVSGNGNNFTVNNLTSDDQVIDTPTNNYSTLNSLNSWGDAVLSEGNLRLTSTETAFDHTSATIHINSGKWYMEFNAVATSGGSAVACFLAGTGEFQNDQTSWISSGDGSFGIGMNGFKITDGVEEESNSFSAVSSGDIVQIAYDSDSGEAWFGINNTWLASGNPSTSANPYFTSTKLQNNDVVLKLITYTSSNTSIANFGQDSSFAGTKTKQSNQDSNSQGNFFYAPPTDFLALNTKNLSEVLG
jgi:hypothetical protein